MANAILAGSLVKVNTPVKRQIDPNNPPMPHGDHFGRDRWHMPLWAVILGSVILGIIFLSAIFYMIIAVRRRRRNKTTTSDIKKSIAHQRSMSGISEDDPDNIKPVKRLRSFHMKGAMASSPESMSPRTPKTPKDASLFGRFFRKRDGKKLDPLDEEKDGSYASLNRYPDTPGMDEKMLEASPPPTPAPAFGWGSSAGGQPGQNNPRSMSDGIGEQSTAYKGDSKPPTGQSENDGFLSSSHRDSRDSKRLSTDYNENYQSRPSGGLFDDDDNDEKRPLSYNPDSRSGH